MMKKRVFKKHFSFFRFYAIMRIAKGTAVWQSGKRLPRSCGRIYYDQRYSRKKNTDDIQKINKIVTKYGFDIWIHGKSGMVDAKEPAHGMFLLSPEQAASGRSGRTTRVPGSSQGSVQDLAEYLEIDDED